MDTEPFVYTPYWEHSIYIPNEVYSPDHAKRVATECGGCTVVYAAGGWVSPEGTRITEPVTILQTLTRHKFAPRLFPELHRELRSKGEVAVLVTRRQLDAAGI